LSKLGEKAWGGKKSGGSKKRIKTRGGLGIRERSGWGYLLRIGRKSGELYRVKLFGRVQEEMSREEKEQAGIKSRDLASTDCSTLKKEIFKEKKEN